MVGGEHSLKMSASQLLPFGIYDVLKIWRKSTLNELINDEAVYRTAPATPCLLKKVERILFKD